VALVTSRRRDRCPARTELEIRSLEVRGSVAPREVRERDRPLRACGR
jgi:hypothetical protein